MPAVSRNQRAAMAIAASAPEKLLPRNRSLLKMSKPQLHDFASTPEKGLPKTTGTLKRLAGGKK